MTTVVYTDGACSGNPGPGGWAWAVPGGAFASGAERQSTNQRMEIAAALEAVRTLRGPVKVVSDSTYVVNCFRDRWWEGWEARGWKNKAKKDVANQDLWKPLIELYKARRGEIEFQWVKGHSGDAMNDLVDRLAVEAAETQRGRSGDEPPTTLGPADKPRGGRERGTRGSGAAGGSGSGSTGASGSSGSSGLSVVGAASPVPGVTAERELPGHPLVVVGHRPPELGGYDDNPIARAVRSRLTEIIAAKATLHPDLLVVSGLLLGAEVLGAEAALEAGVPLIAVLPYPDPQSVWPKSSQDRFFALRDAAQDVVVLQKRDPSSKQQAGAAVARRDAWLTRNVAEAIVVWDGIDPAVGRSARSFEDRLGEDVWVLNPADVPVEP